ncbi:MAG: carboxypeptidase regulatory-like domain-containing protein, partial [Acidobacteria bacterium]|nr:carboxypeptidase regulatory-like domain-containing protein [Acidobacteriota bacterium]
MLRKLICICATAGWISAAGASTVWAQRNDGSLRVVVKDPSGAVVPGALVQVKGAEDRTAAVTRTDIASDGQGVATATGLTPGRYALDVSFPGFERLSVPDVRVRAGENRRDA